VSKFVGFQLGKVHESHVISEYYCGGCSWPVTDHDSFCPECGGAFRECDASDLEDENARLRSCLSDDAENARQILGESRALKTKNERLKERNKKLVTLVSHLMYVKPRDVTGITYKGEFLRFDDLLEEVGLRWEDA